MKVPVSRMEPLRVEIELPEGETECKVELSDG